MDTIFVINKCLRVHSQGLKKYIEEGLNKVYFIGEPSKFEQNTLSKLQYKLNKMNIELYISDKSILETCNKIYSYVDWGPKTELFADYYVWKTPSKTFTKFYSTIVYEVEKYQKCITPSFKKVKITNPFIKPDTLNSDPYKSLKILLTRVTKKIEAGTRVCNTLLSLYINNGLLDPCLFLHTLQNKIDIKFFLIRDFYKNYYKTLVIPKGNGSNKYFKEWSTGRTGYIMIDTIIKAILEDGYVDYQKRYLAAHFWIHKCKGDWTLGEQFFAKHSLDYDKELSICNWLYCEGYLDPIKSRNINYEKLDYTFLEKYPTERVLKIID